MGTRSDIIVQRADGKWAQIYCHWDGYLSHNGKLLFEHYNSQDKAEALVALGGISTLGKEIGEKHDFDFRTSITDKYKNEPNRYELADADPEMQRLGKMCNAYGRDRGESGMEAQIGDSLQAVWPEGDTWTEFTYVWSRDHGNPEGQWYVTDPDEGTQTLAALEAALKGEVAVTPKVKAFGGLILGQHKPYQPEPEQPAIGDS